MRSIMSVSKKVIPHSAKKTANRISIALPFNYEYVALIIIMPKEWNYFYLSSLNSITKSRRPIRRNGLLVR